MNWKKGKTAAMMYSPPHYQENRNDLALDLIRNFGFATIITQEIEGPFVSHLPLILESQQETHVLVGHCAKANPQWRHIADGQIITAIFHGPHSYISPAWYEPRKDNVPTWNYAVVHVKGSGIVFSDPDKKYEILKKTVQQFEHDYQTGWMLPEKPNPELAGLLEGITAFKIEINDLQAKFKLSQKQSPLDRENVIINLPKVSPDGEKLATLMTTVLEKKP